MSILIIHRATLTSVEHDLLTSTFGQTATKVSQHHRLQLDSAPTTEQLTALRAASDWDINLLPSHFDGSQVKLIMSDMDSTLINIECIDEIGEHLGVKAQISDITEAAMRGELDFEQSFSKRVALLAGTPVSALESVYHNRLQLNEGAEALVATARQKGIKFALVSGGFTFFTDRLQARLGLDFTRANPLEMDAEQRVTGRISAPIVGAEAKRIYLHELCDQLGISSTQAIAVGDGANDLLMMQDAGLSVAYHAKPKVQAEAKTVLNHRGLDAIIDFLE